MNTNIQLQPRDSVEEYFAPIAQHEKVSITALVGVVVGKLAKAKKGTNPTQEEMIEFAALCRQAGLNPATSEVAPLVQGGRVSLIISVDGWIKVARSQPEFKGYKLIPSETTVKAGQNEVPEYITSQIYVNGLDFPLEWRTYYREVMKSSSPVWQTMPNHMMQVRALANGIKRSFGLAAFTPDEADNIMQATAELVEEEPKHKGRNRVMAALKKSAPKALEQKPAEVFEQRAPTQAEIEAREEKAQAGYNDLMAKAVADQTSAPKGTVSDEELF